MMTSQIRRQSLSLSKGHNKLLVDGSGISHLIELLKVEPKQELLNYLENLLESDYQTLVSQPKILAKENTKYHKELETLICTEYKAFIEAHRHACEMRDALTKYPR
jgi:hypothetical protein